MNDSDTDARQPALRLVASPQDTNAAGDIFGGWIMAQVDVAGSVAAYRRAGGRVATVAVDSLQFHQPVLIGDLVSCYAEVIKVGTTSITVHVEVVVERDSRTGIARLKVTEANLVYVALDESGRPRPV
ncbi:MAG TPA: acyl-CoA thioesterase [Thiohalobacter sp.]|nr:acyl-CoA thioesterase [Thiohalobacter sp.]